MSDTPKPAPPKQRLMVYIDGFNLYNGIHDWSSRRYLWLDLVELARSFRPDQRLVGVRYFTAPVLDNRGAQSRQGHYMDALRSKYPRLLEIIEGRYQTKMKQCRACGATWKSYEEKETDVNLATRILMDASAGACDTILVITGDSDVAPAVRAAQLANKRLFIAAAFPPERYSRELQDLMPASFHIGHSKIRKAQFPDEFEAGGKVFRRPGHWS